MTTINRSIPAPTSTGSQVTGRQLATAVGVWICLAAVLGSTTILGLSLLAPDWDPTIGPTVVVVAEVYGALVAALLLVCGGWSGLRERLAWSARHTLLSLFSCDLGRSVITCTAFHVERAWGSQHWPRLLGDLAGRLNESTLGTAS